MTGCRTIYQSRKPKTTQNSDEYGGLITGKQRSDTLGETKAQRLRQTLGNVVLTAVIDAKPFRLLERKSKTLIKALGNLEAMKLLFTLSDTICQTEARKLRHTLV